jgi:hypothetical protein
MFPSSLDSVFGAKNVSCHGRDVLRINNATLCLGPAGDLAVFCGQATSAAHLILAISGYFE